MNSLINTFKNQVVIGDTTLFLPNFGGVIQGGLLATVGFFMSIFFSAMVVIWVALSIYAGIRIISSAGNPEGIEKGTTTIKNIWIGIAMGLGFFALLSLAGAFVGFGNVYEWSTKLAQCGGADSRFYFQMEQQELEDLRQSGSSQVYIACCPYGPGGSYDWKFGDTIDIPSIDAAASLKRDCPIFNIINY